jgi:hypothetical protein
MGLQVPGLRASRSAGTKASFDGQPMAADSDLLWSFKLQPGSRPMRSGCCVAMPGTASAYLFASGRGVHDQTAQCCCGNYLGSPVSYHRRAHGPARNRQLPTAAVPALLQP